ncbi:DUF6807 family protein [Actinacidiphila yeochonensis]|uniref:DUF6807 family protein n=1 Tax=Actinacidiphila yeochonensis TaxID=89050 RepID=UPI00099D58D2|nr:DUF6807 family protein [Actinacidiphila yeochonensis]
MAAALLPGSWSRPALGPAHRTEHTGFTALAAGGRTVFTATLDWYAADGRHRVTEARRWQVLDLEPEGGSWTLEFATELRNTAGEPLHFAGAAPFGRELPGHCGFFWRGPEGVAGGAVTQPAGSGPVEAGARAPWLAFTGEFGAEPAAEPAGPVPAVERVGTVLTGTAPSGAAPSGTELLGAEPAGREPDPAGRRGGQPAGRPGRHPVTLVFAADPRLPGGAPYWRVRHGRAPVVDPRPALERQPPLAPGATLRLAYRLVVADGRWDRERIAAHLADHPW